MNPKKQRRRIFIDRPIQTAVLLRTAAYWGMCTMAQVLIVLFIGIIVSSQTEFPTLHPQVWWHLQVTLLAQVVLLPILLLDVLKLSHRWVGPIFRLRATLQTLRQGQSLSEVRFRDRDFWHDLAFDLNALAAELDKKRASRQAATEDEDSDCIVAAAAADGNFKHQDVPEAVAP